MKRVREFLESIVYAGMKPGGQKAQGEQLKWLGPLRAPFERLLSGSAPTDPLYLTNRTTSQKMRSWLVIGIPCLVLVACIGIALSNLLDPPSVKPTKELTASEIAAKILPNVANDIKLAANPDIQVVEVAVRHDGGSRVTGAVHNTTGHEIGGVHLVLDLTDGTGSQVGGVSATVDKVPAHGNKDFQFAIKQRDAQFALVREVTTR